MKILINSSNSKLGGGIQVTDSICSNLYRYPQHSFVVVLSEYMKDTQARLAGLSNVKVVEYTIKNRLATLILGRDKFLDNLVKKESVQAVCTVFGPSRWNPKCLHISGFALGHLLLFSESPFYEQMPTVKRLFHSVKNSIYRLYFKRSTKFFYTENPYITEKLQHYIKGTEVRTITNYYNQVFDNPSLWEKYNLAKFDGITFLTITAAYPHKNLIIAIQIAENMRARNPKQNFRFVMTIDSASLDVPTHLKDNFVFTGKVDIVECPSLYEQCDIVFMPTLMECFSAGYVEAMKMEKPIITTDLEFARGLCKDAALYYSPVSSKDATEKIISLINDDSIRRKLIENGKKQLKTFDNYNERTDKIIGYIEDLYNNKPY